MYPHYSLNIINLNFQYNQIKKVHQTILEWSILEKVKEKNNLPRKRASSSVYEQHIRVVTVLFKLKTTNSCHVSNSSGSKLHAGR
jgi:hypothetical protein